ncbi:ABC transporter ATP-binding protein/permease [Tissierella sp. MSJ-40]|uniref:ABC transporter ATP-binding protein/permease n=1 Tax=Tissierella simiarum TaxID=2841534 RepID=A0ABS6E7K9_9FIRM|nr:ABC transporter ATP-binding protein [Tissierella simiarum]MBU5438901.1 ABC transporter ATP-binding protein/permease [Tissierella simiarum]
MEPRQSGNKGVTGISGLRGPRSVMPVIKPKNLKETLNRLWSYFRSEKKLLFIVFLLILISSGLGLLVPYFIGKAIDTMYLGKMAVNFKGLGIIIGILTVVYIMDSLMSFLQDWIMAGISQRIVFNLRETLFAKLQNLPISFFDVHTHGEIMSRLSNDIDNVSTTISQSTVQLMSSAINILGSFIMMLILSRILTIASMVTIPMVLLMTRNVAKRTKVLFKEQQSILGNLNGHIEESISGIQVVKAFNNEDKVIEKFHDINSGLCEVGIKAQIWSGYIMPLMNVINNIGFGVVAVLGGILAVKDMITVGVIASFLSYSRQFSRPLNELANTFNTIQSGLAGAERVFEILDEEEEIEDLKDARELENVKGEVVFNKVTFGYNPDFPILEHISFKVEAGSNIALVGPTGAGKTTIVNLLTRFYEITEGEILIDGKDIREYSRDSLRKCFGMVLQDTYLFSGTVKENIRYGRLEASDEEIERAATMARADEFIKKMPKGYDTVLGEGGLNLSQGERQLLAISRAILANPSILILDEATSSVDTRTEFKIQEAMVKLMKNRTTFIIAHRLSTIKDADIIMVIDGGKIVESGSHNELMIKRGAYYRLYKSQFMNVIIEN